MPEYLFECECGEIVEVVLSMHEVGSVDPGCVVCDRTMRRVYTAPALHLSEPVNKGYVDDWIEDRYPKAAKKLKGPQAE